MKQPKNNIFFTADFETNNSEEAINNNASFVWLWDICDKKQDRYIHYSGHSIDTFINFLANFMPSSRIWFHNLKFDGNFIISYLLQNSFTWLPYEKKMTNGTFKTLISFKKIFYSIKVKINNKIFECVDSSKKITGTVEEIAKSWGLPILKGEIDYTKDRQLGYIPTLEEYAYIHNDTEIIYRVMEYEYQDGLTQMTTASDCLALFKETIGGDKMYRSLFPELTIEEDNYIRRAYRGGFCWVNPKFKGKVLSNIHVFDENSMYPDKMYNKPLPYDKPIFYQGKYKESVVYNLYIQHIKVACNLKDDGIPCILLHSQIFQSEYLVSTKNEMIDLYLTSIDLKLLFDNYEVQDIEYIDGVAFKSNNKLFRKYIEPIYISKCNTKGSEKMLAKLKLNGLYGKFASNPINYIIEPKLNEKGIVTYIVSGSEYSEPEYTALSCFVTAYAREDIIYILKANLPYAVYCDTDSAHLLEGFDPSTIRQDSKKLGYYKLERVLFKAKYLAQKTYYGFEQMENKVVEYKKICGASKEVKSNITFKRFNFGEEFEGKLVPKIVRGGVVLVNTTFTLKERKKGLI